jgi:hypothetical protein
MRKSQHGRDITLNYLLENYTASSLGTEVLLVRLAETATGFDNLKNIV